MNNFSINNEQINDLMTDIRIKNPRYNFHYRVAGIIIQDDKFLIQQIEGSEYYILPGGHVLLGESSRQAIIRELKEEISDNIDIEELNMFCFHENFYSKKEKIEHWIENYYIVKLKNRLNSNSWTLAENDNGEEKKLHYFWVSKEELEVLDLKPTSIKNLLIDNKYNEFNYIIDGER